jgi:hypothetical protein
MTAENGMSNYAAMQGIAASLTCHYRPPTVTASKTMDEDVITFMACVMEAIGMSRPVDLERLLVNEGIFDYSEGRKIKKWRRGENGPSFHSTMRLLRRAGFLSPKAVACLESHHAPRPVSRSSGSSSGSRSK